MKHRSELRQAAVGEWEMVIRAADSSCIWRVAVNQEQGQGLATSFLMASAGLRFSPKTAQNGCLRMQSQGSHSQCQVNYPCLDLWIEAGRVSLALSSDISLAARCGEPVRHHRDACLMRGGMMDHYTQGWQQRHVQQQGAAIVMQIGRLCSSSGSEKLVGAASLPSTNLNLFTCL